MQSDLYSAERGGGSPLRIGDKVGSDRFTLIKELGRGGMGVVWLAQDTRLHEQVALKFLPPEIRTDAGALDDLRRETLRSRRLSHPNIVRIHDLHEAPGETPFLSMEYVDGPNLLALRVAQLQRVFIWTQLQPWVRQLCAALDYAHGEKIVHRDLKPGNLMLDSQGRLKLADFGIAAVVSDSMSRVSMPRTSGTLAYMSPQQLEGRRAQPTDDIYALGATLYELLTSKPPFHTGDLTHQILHVPATPLAERLAELDLTNEVPADVAALVMACLAKDPAQRPPSARAVAEWVGLGAELQPSGRGLIEPTIQDESTRSSGISQGPEIQPQRLTGRTLTWFAGTAVLLGLIVAIAWLNRRGASTPSRDPVSPTVTATIGRWTNTLGMVFVPVPGTDAQFSIWETRVQDFEAFAKATGLAAGGSVVVFKNGRVQHDSGASWKSPGFRQGPTHPVVGVSWNDATAFCDWLTKSELRMGRLASGQSYRLPTDQEWSSALASSTQAGAYPWGEQWPPPAGIANLAGDEARDGDWPAEFSTISGYRDRFPRTAPVGNFPANRLGLFDLEGNALEWSGGETSADPAKRSVRWAGWLAGRADWCAKSFGSFEQPDWRGAGVGFRVVLAKRPTVAAASASGDWITLFDGRSTEAWRGYNRQTFPTEGWEVEESALRTFAQSKTPDLDSPDLITKQSFKDFELEFEWRVSLKGDSGVYYGVGDESRPLAASGGVEMQVVDDDHRLTMSPDCVAGAAALLIAPSDNRILRPVGEFNRSRILVQRGQVQHWLNGSNILEYAWGGQPMREACARLKAMHHVYSPRLDEYGGHIALQHAYAGTVWYRNIRIRRL